MLYKCILVEDDGLLRKSLFHNLPWESCGFSVQAMAENGGIALKQMETYRPELVITDIRMPVMDGLALIEQTYNRFPGTHFVILTGYGDFAYAKTAIRCGVNRYLIKPLNRDEMLETLRDMYTLIEEERARNEKLQTSRVLLVEQTFHWFLDGKIKTFEATERLTELRFNVFDARYRVYRFARGIRPGGNRVEDARLPSAAPERSWGADAVINLLHERLEAFGDCCVYDEPDGSITAVAAISRRIQERPTPEELCDAVRQTLELGLEGGIGTTDGTLAELPALVAQAEKALQQNLLRARIEQSDSCRRLVSNAIRVINTADLRILNLEYVAEHIFVSPSYLSKIFRQTTGERFIDYVTKAKINQAKQLLRMELDTERVSELVGYESEKHFIRVFKNVTGKTVSEFRRTGCPD